MCFISPKNVERKLENKEKKSNLNRGVTKLCFTTGSQKITGLCLQILEVSRFYLVKNGISPILHSN